MGAEGCSLQPHILKLSIYQHACVFSEGVDSHRVQTTHEVFKDYVRAPEAPPTHFTSSSLTCSLPHARVGLGHLITISLGIL